MSATPSTTILCWSVVPVNGESFTIDLPKKSTCAQAKSAICQIIGCGEHLQDIFLRDCECLADDDILSECGGEDTDLYLILRVPPLSWEQWDADLVPAGSELTMRKRTGISRHKIATGNQVVSNGETAYWEVELASGKGGMFFYVGAVNPRALDHKRGQVSRGFFLYMQSGTLYGKGISGGGNQQGLQPIKVGDKVGVLVDLRGSAKTNDSVTAGSGAVAESGSTVRFFVNGQEHGPGFSRKVSGPLALGVVMGNVGQAVCLVPDVVPPPVRCPQFAD